MEKSIDSQIKEIIKERESALRMSIKYEGIAEYLTGKIQELENQKNGNKEKKEEQGKESGSNS